mgnify:FL=1
MYNTGHTIIRIYTLGGFILLPFFFLPPSKLQFKLDDYYVYTVVLFPFLLHFFFFFNFVVVFSWKLLFQWHLILFYSRFLPSSDFDRYRLMYITTRYSKFYFIWSDTLVFLCVCVCFGSQHCFLMMFSFLFLRIPKLKIVFLIDDLLRVI